MKIAIVEDENVNAEMLFGYVERYNRENNQTISATVFKNAVDFLTDYDCEFSAVFLDIDMPMMNGMDAARRLRGMDSNISIIFVTRLAQYAVNAFEVGALDYIVKPVSYFHFASKLDKAVMVNRAATDSSIPIVLKDKCVVVKMSEIYYVESNAHFVTYHTAKGDFSVRKMLSEVYRELSRGKFAFSGKSWLVNLAHVDSIDGDTVVVAGTSLPITRSKKREFMAALTIYFGCNVGGG